MCLNDSAVAQAPSGRGARDGDYGQKEGDGDRKAHFETIQLK